MGGLEDDGSEEQTADASQPRRFRSFILAPLLERPLRMRPATSVLVSFLLAHVIGSTFVTFICIGILESQKKRNLTFEATVIEVGSALEIGGAAFLGLLIVLFMSPRLFRSQIGVREPTGAAWIRGGVRECTIGLLAGALLGGCYLGFAVVAERWFPVTTVGPIAEMANEGGFPRFVWLVIALLLAPWSEELLFRGVLYAGYRRSFGPRWSAILTTGLFVGLHVSEFAYFYPAVIGVVALGLATLAVRLRFGAIGPAIALHTAYNGVIALTVLFGS